MKKIKKEDLLEAIELANDQGEYYCNKATGEIVYISEEDRRMAEDCTEEDLENYPDWQRDGIEAAIEVEVNWDNYISLPSSYDINEYDIMVEFCYFLDDNKRSNELLSALKGKGAFRRFKDMVTGFNIDNKWYKFREEALMKIALEWCEENDMEI